MSSQPTAPVVDVQLQNGLGCGFDVTDGATVLRSAHRYNNIGGYHWGHVY
jgi:hypothetical protein